MKKLLITAAAALLLGFMISSFVEDKPKPKPKPKQVILVINNPYSIITNCDPYLNTGWRIVNMNSQMTSFQEQGNHYFQIQNQLIVILEK